ncbi:6-bladed beta-propeller [Algoriphagus halophytocola]|uniref:6-bladed beta-propeller n=1 Tax=Algoriphagus halophytocola TaxID=2991499 RepID=A0ABY6MJX4_9BACT|nr:MULTISPECIES: 6-bladed beta-propeller [unclassified Algoriphagus]UZD24083.1 6-bladed beta-propeller [Algoriphagus sp. TR-M5]WBL41454.1 6-bladed beta-propeller [Algoriphagus sp. TR-M9]
MILRSRINILWLLSFSVIACSPSENNDGLPGVEITESNIVEIDEAISSIEFIPLKNQEDSPVNLNCSVWNLKVTEEFLVYSTICNPEAKIHLFDLRGNYIKSFQRIGNGPEEYQNLQGVDLNQDTLSITVGGGVIKQYSFPDFEFIGTVTLDKNALFIPYFTKISSTKWLTSPMFDGNLDENGEFSVFKILDSSTGEITELPITGTPITAEISEGEFARLGENSLLFNYAFSDTLYLFEIEKSTPLISLDFGARKPSAKDLKMDGEKFEATVTSQPFVINMGKIWHTEDVSRLKTFALAKNPEMDITNMRTFPVHEVFIDHKSKRAIAFQSLAGWSNGNGFATDGYFYDVLRTEDWIYALEKGSLGKYGEELEQIINDLEDFEDPILIKYQVKMNE